MENTNDLNQQENQNQNNQQKNDTSETVTDNAAEKIEVIEEKNVTDDAASKELVQETDQEKIKESLKHTRTDDLLEYLKNHPEGESESNNVALTKAELKSRNVEIPDFYPSEEVQEEEEEAKPEFKKPILDSERQYYENIIKANKTAIDKLRQECFNRDEIIKERDATIEDLIEKLKTATPSADKKES